MFFGYKQKVCYNVTNVKENLETNVVSQKTMA